MIASQKSRFMHRVTYKVYNHYKTRCVPDNNTESKVFTKSELHLRSLNGNTNPQWMETDDRKPCPIIATIRSDPIHIVKIALHGCTEGSTFLRTPISL